MFTPKEQKAVFSLSLIYAFRMLGLFILIPIISPYLQSLEHATPLLIGITIGIYGLTQAVFQIPFGVLADYWGRKEVITMGLILFAFGSLLAGFAHDIWGVLIGRALQGAGAISGALIALLSDLTNETSRTKAMAFIGMSIGSSFMLAFMLGPILNSVLSIQTIFYGSAGLVFPVLLILWKLVPDSSRNLQSEPASFASILTLFKNKHIFASLKIHSLGIFVLHGVLVINFLAIPILLNNLGVSRFDQGLSYVKIFLITICFVIPLISFAEKKYSQKNLMLISVLLLILSEIIFWLLNNTFWGIMLGLGLFFIGFNVLEASLPSIISKLAPKQSKGTAMGLYSTAQFLGPMLGGVLSGIFFKYFGLTSIFILALSWLLVWFVGLVRIKNKTLA